MGNEYLALFPDFELRDTRGNETPQGYEQILFLRYLCEGKYAEPGGRQLSYREIPWGEVYYRNFEGRCIGHFARTFGKEPERLLGITALRAERLDKGNAGGPITHLGYRFEFCTGLYMSVLFWAADEEFPPSAQILFDDNFPAEDIAVACTVAADRLKDMETHLPR